jgi:hypothetical protein
VSRDFRRRNRRMDSQLEPGRHVEGALMLLALKNQPIVTIREEL